MDFVPKYTTKRLLSSTIKDDETNNVNNWSLLKLLPREDLLNVEKFIIGGDADVLLYIDEPTKQLRGIGRNERHQLCHGENQCWISEPFNIPIGISKLQFGRQVKDISLGMDFAAVLLNSSRLYIFGVDFASYGYGTTLPRPLCLGSGFVQVKASTYHMVAMKDGGELYHYGWLGDDTVREEFIIANALDFAVAPTYSAAIVKISDKINELRLWGETPESEEDKGLPALPFDVHIPVNMPFGFNPCKVAIAHNHFFVLGSDQTVNCYQMKRNFNSDDPLLVPIPTTDVVRIYAHHVENICVLSCDNGRSKNDEPVYRRFVCVMTPKDTNPFSYTIQQTESTVPDIFFNFTESDSNVYSLTLLNENAKAMIRDEEIYPKIQDFNQFTGPTNPYPRNRKINKEDYSEFEALLKQSKIYFVKSAGTNGEDTKEREVFTNKAIFDRISKIFAELGLIKKFYSGADGVGLLVDLPCFVIYLYLEYEHRGTVSYFEPVHLVPLIKTSLFDIYHQFAWECVISVCRNNFLDIFLDEFPCEKPENLPIWRAFIKAKKFELKSTPGFLTLKSTGGLRFIKFVYITQMDNAYQEVRFELSIRHSLQAEFMNYFESLSEEEQIFFRETFDFPKLRRIVSVYALQC